jgi:hypothetical protein
MATLYASPESLAPNVYPSKTVTSQIFDNLIISTSAKSIATSTINGAFSRNDTVLHHKANSYLGGGGSFKPIEAALANRPPEAQATTLPPFSS